MPDKAQAPSDIGAVVIGRNEGARLVTCLTSLARQLDHIVYVDSGSTDNSVAAAQDIGAEVIVLDTDRAFTAARARNAGVAHLQATWPDLELVQFVDGDCEMRDGWIATARQFLDAHASVVAVCGRVRERHPDATVYNRLADAEWDAPSGETRACGGIAMMRIAAFQAAGGFNPGLIAGEEPELCVRMRMSGGQIWRLEAEMVWHDIAMTRFSQWWRRRRRAGYAFANGVVLHGRPPERHYVPQLRRSLSWGLALPLLVFAGLLLTPWALLLALAWPAQVLRLRLRGMSWSEAFFTPLGTVPETTGALTYLAHRVLQRDSTLIEYK